jgi:hypothetical protein
MVFVPSCKIGLVSLLSVDKGELGPERHLRRDLRRETPSRIPTEAFLCLSTLWWETIQDWDD